MNTEVDYYDSFNTREKNAIADGLENGVYNPYLVFSYDQWKEAKKDILADPYQFAKKIEAETLNIPDINALDKIYNDFYNSHNKNALKAPLDDPDYLLDIAFNLHGYQYPMVNEYYAVRSKYKQNLKKFNNLYGVPYWKRWYTRLNKVADRGQHEIKEIIKENFNGDYKGDYPHGEYGLVDAPKLPGHKYWKKLGKATSLITTVADITNNAIINAKVRNGVIDTLKNTAKHVSTHWLKLRPFWWGKKRADIREAKREGKDITSLKAKYGAIDAAAYYGSSLFNYKYPGNPDYLNGVLVRDPFTMDKKETKANKMENKPQNTKQKAFIDIGSSNIGAGGGGRRYWYPSAKKKYGNRKYRPLRSYYSRYWRRRRYSKKGARYYKKYKKYGRYYRFFK